MMRTHIDHIIAVIAVLVLSAAPAQADVDAGAALVQSHGCIGCHRAQLTTLGADRGRAIDALLHPKAPMPNYGFTPAQAGDIADYLASLGGAPGQPRIIITPAHLSDFAIVTVSFSGPAPSAVTASASMSMGGSAMGSPQIQLQRSPDGHTYKGRIAFSMGGAWTLHIRYGGKQIDRPLEVGQ